MYQQHTIGRNIFVIDKYCKLYLKEALKSYDLNATESMVLVALFRKETCDENSPHSFGKTQDQLIGELQYDKGVMARTMQTLEKKGYLTREVHPKDNRSYLFHLTEKAHGVIPIIIQYLKEWQSSLLETIDETEAVQLNRILQKMAENASRKFEKELLE